MNKTPWKSIPDENSLRVSGLEELDNEDPAKVALCLFNSTMNMQSRDPACIYQWHRSGSSRRQKISW